ncbi:MAG: APC family permease [Solirubrobacteraceae bacterium]
MATTPQPPDDRSENRTGSDGPDAEVSEGESPDATVSATAQVTALDPQEMEALDGVGRTWSLCMPPRRIWEQALPVDRHLDFADPVPSRGGRFVHIRSASAPAGEDDSLETAGEDDSLEVAGDAPQGASPRARVRYALRRVLIGPALRSTAIAEERLGRLAALGVLSPDALSSVAYGPEAMMAILVLAGAGELKLSLPIGAALVVLMLSVGLGYRQVVRAYPHGGGSYIVASDSLGSQWGLLAGAGLIVDYFLTVAISVAAGVAAVTSAIPSLSPATVPIGLGVIALLVAGNLRGAREASAAFAAPTFLFVGAIALVVTAGLIKASEHGFHAVAPAPHHATEAIGVLLVLRAFASGATAMTGIEVISNAVPEFRPPEAKHARQTLALMVGLLITMFAGVVLVAYLDGAEPGGNQTVLSKLAHHSVGHGVGYAFIQVATTLVLLVAANSAFNGFPRLLYFIARDNFAPRLFLRLGDRLAFTNGIIVLAIPAAVIFVAFRGQTDPLIPLFAVGVFVAFTLAQSGMVAHWWRHRGRGWRSALVTNLVGAVMSGIVVLVAAVTKFVEGAWVVVVLVTLIVLAARRVHEHYRRARQALTPRADAPGVVPIVHVPSPRLVPAAVGEEVEQQDAPVEVHGFVVVPVAALDLAGLHALAYAVSLGQPVLAVHVSPTDDEAARFKSAWRAWGDHLPLEVVVSPYRATVAPLANYVEALHRQREDVTLTLVVPELIVAKAWHRLLHNRISQRLRAALIAYEGIVITTVPFHLPA